MINKKIVIIFVIVLVLLVGSLYLVKVLFFNKNSFGLLKQINQTTSSTVQETKGQVYFGIESEVKDVDLDGVSDEKEKELGLSNSDFDTDKDGLSDYVELQIGTDPKKFDTDNDGFNDGEEVGNGYNPKGSGKL